MFVAGFEKTAAGMSLSSAAVGARGGLKQLSKPAAVTRPSLKTLTGATDSKGTFSRPINSFGTSPKKGLVSRTAVATGRAP